MGTKSTSPSPFSELVNKNAHLKGRRRFNADLADIEQASSSSDLVEYGFKIQGIHAGDDEGTVEVDICGVDGRLFSFNLLISDTSDYPKSHVFFCSSPDPNFQTHLSDVIEDSSRTIYETIQKVLGSLVKHQGSAATRLTESQEIDIDEEDNSVSDYDSFDQYEDIGLEGEKKLDKRHLQKDFIEVVATGYRPGFLNFADDDFAITVSIPVVVLARSIPPRALMAWDRRLLSRSQHLTLLVSGFRGVYPPLDSGGLYTTDAQRSGVSLAFKVGLTGKYKPEKEYAKDAVRTYGLIQTDAEDELRNQADNIAASDDIGYDDDGISLTGLPIAVQEDYDEGRFDRFSLSSSLESLLDHSFLKVLQLRRKFGLGWAGAELLHAIVEKTQKTAEYVFDVSREDLIQADTDEEQLSRTTELPHDPLLSLRTQDAVNVVLAAVCYLLCPRYCLVCHNKLKTEFDALKPYYEIVHNPNTVDLLVSLTHSAATEQVLHDPLPIGLGLRVQPPDFHKVQHTTLPGNSTQSNVDDMKKHLERKVQVGKAKPRLKDVDPAVLPAAWCVASCTAYLEEISTGEESIKNLDSGWRQFRFSVGAPDAEAKFNAAVSEAQQRNTNAIAHPSLYVDRFSSRYLLVKGALDTSFEPPDISNSTKKTAYPLVRLDPTHLVTLNGKRIEIPEPTHQIAVLLAARLQEFSEEDNDNDDAAIFEIDSTHSNVVEEDDKMDVDVEYSKRNVSTLQSKDWKHDADWVRRVVESLLPPPFEASQSATMAVQRELRSTLKEQENAPSLKELGWFIPPDLIGDNLFQWIIEMHSFEDNLPITRDLKARNINSVVFEIRFPPTFPIAPPFFRILSPRFLPFIQGGGGHVTAGGSICMDLLTSDGKFRSCLCIQRADTLLGWLPSYSIPAVLLQIKLAISNLEPRPARLASDYDRSVYMGQALSSPFDKQDRPYNTQEALIGFKRAADTHGWRVPIGIEKLLQ
ncbi:hypothetical protein H0H93_002957 [Arthromyces matolae]|nr:hypothetical protein H0H93_002957 [Arthromyces matolae]